MHTSLQFWARLHFAQVPGVHVRRATFVNGLRCDVCRYKELQA